MVSHGRIRAITTIIALLFCAAIMRVLQVQVLEYPVHANTVDQQQISDVTMVAPRGAIFDRNGNTLAVSNRAFVIRINTVVVTDTQAALNYANAIAPALGQPVDSLRQRIDAIVTDSHNTPRTLPNIIAYNISPAAIEAFRKARADFKLDGAWEEEHWTRNYPFGALAGPTVGFVTMFGNNFSGIEAFANSELADTPGERRERTKMDLLAITPTLSGANVVLSLDMNLQAYVEERLARAVSESGSKSGTVIVQETATGRILASASAPGYDPNHVLELAQNPDTAKWLKDPAVSDTYEPGSVMKLCSISAALDAGVITPDSVFMDTGRIVIEGKSIRNSDLAAHGNVDVTTALAKSLNVVAVQIAERLGAEQMYRAYRAFGLGNRTGIDLGGEAPGTLRTPEDEKWSKIDLATNSFGQGMASSPMQVINAINAIGNDGLLMQPYVIQEWRDVSGNVITKKPVTVQRAISAEAAQTMRAMMLKATHAATPEAGIKGYTIAGKTGTADWYLRGIKQETTIVTYVGFVPAKQPRITILVKLDQPRTSRWAKDTTVPVFHDVALKAVHLLGVPPDDISG